MQRLAYLVGDSELAGKIERGLDAQQAILPLTVPEREAMLVALERRGAEGR